MKREGVRHLAIGLIAGAMAALAMPPPVVLEQHLEARTTVAPRPRRSCLQNCAMSRSRPASWLLLHRAVKEGEMTLVQANREKIKVKLSAADPGPADAIEKLPQQLQDLIARSMSLQSRVRLLDATIHTPLGDRTGLANPLVAHLNRLKAAFEQ